MNEGPKEKKYDTNPLDKKVADRAEAEMERDVPLDEAPTRPMSPQVAYMPPRDDYATWAPPTTGPIQPRQFTSPNPTPQLRGSAQHGIKPNFAAMLCYLPYAGIVSSVVLNQIEPPENHFVRFHAKQGIYAHAAFWAIAIAFNIAKAAAPPVVDAILLLPQVAFYLASIAGFVYMMISTYKWETMRIPIIGEQVE